MTKILTVGIVDGSIVFIPENVSQNELKPFCTGLQSLHDALGALLKVKNDKNEEDDRALARSVLLSPNTSSRIGYAVGAFVLTKAAYDRGEPFDLARAVAILSEIGQVTQSTIYSKLSTQLELENVQAFKEFLSEAVINLDTAKLKDLLLAHVDRRSAKRAAADRALIEEEIE